MMTFLQTIFGNGGTGTKTPPTPPETKPTTPPEPQTTTPPDNDGDIEALKEMYELKAGTTLEVELARLLVLCPRRRRRIDAYAGLVKKLRVQYGVELRIYSQKTKNNDAKN